MPAKKDGGSGNDLIFCCREATNDSFLAKITSRAIWPGFGLQRATGSILTLAGPYLTKLRPLSRAAFFSELKFAHVIV